LLFFRITKSNVILYLVLFKNQIQNLNNLKSFDWDRIDKMADDELDFDDGQEDLGVDEIEDNTELDLGMADIAGVNKEVKKLYAQHPELVIDYKESIMNRIPLKVVQPSNSKPDENHTTYPFVTLYERTKIIGLRANQLSQGARALVEIPKEITDVRDIARLEYEQKKLPFIIKRPLPDGTYEYWRLADLMIL